MSWGCLRTARTMVNVPISEPDDSPRRRGLLGGQYKRQRSEDDKNSQDSFIVPDQDEATDPREDPDEDSDAPSHDYPHSPVHKRIKKRTVETPPSERRARAAHQQFQDEVCAQDDASLEPVAPESQTDSIPSIDSDWEARKAAQQQRAQAESSQSDSIPSFDSDWAARIAAQQQRAQADSSQSDSIPSFDSDWLAPPPGTESQETIES